MNKNLQNKLISLRMEWNFKELSVLKEELESENSRFNEEILKNSRLVEDLKLCGLTEDDNRLNNALCQNLNMTETAESNQEAINIITKILDNNHYQNVK